MLLVLIRKWLHKRLGITLNINPEFFFQATFDGTLIAQILVHYGVISLRELEEIEESRDPVVAHDNYSKHIKEWLKRIDCEISEAEIIEIVYGRTTEAASLLYELYMKLENIRGAIHGVKTRGFTVDKVNESALFDTTYEVNPLCEPLMKRWDIINWEKDHLNSILKQYSESKEEYEQYLSKKCPAELKLDIQEQMADNLRFMKTEETNYTYDELIAQQQAVLDMDPFKPDEDEAKRILKQIKQKKKQRAERTAYRIELQHQLMAEVFKKIEETEEQEFDKEICEKLLKQSAHEKEIAEKLLDVRKQRDVMIENRKKQAELDQKKREEEFVRKLFEESLQERMEFHEERMGLVAQHKRLYEEKMKLKALKHAKICRETIGDIMDLSLKNVEYKNTYGLEPDQYLQRDWATLFVKQQPIFDLVAPPSRLRQSIEGASQDLEEIYRKEFLRQDVLDEQDFEDYIKFQKIWQITGFDEFMTLMELGMNCLGYAVHKLLLKKYPIPIPQKPDLSKDIEISVCANAMPDLARIDFLIRLLDLKCVKVIQMEDAVDFCIKSYECELKTEFDEPFPEEEYLKELSPRMAMSVKGIKGNKAKGGKKDKKEKKEKKEKKGKDGKKDKKGKKGTSSTEVIKPTFEDKQAQTPRLFPWEKIVFSNKAKLGKIAKQLLGQDETICDKLLVDMFLEYLLSMPYLKGWVLLNYPTNYEQAALLEQALSGKPVPKQYYNKILNKESLTSVQLEEDSKLSSIVTVDAISAFESPGSMRSPAETKQSETTSALRTMERRQTPSSQTTELSEITMCDTWNVKPKQKVAQILPDLVSLAYSSDEEIDNEEAQDEKKECVCTCSPAASTQQVDSPEWQFGSLDPYYVPVEIISEREEFRSANVDSKSVSQSRITAEIKSQKKRPECVCYLQNVPEGAGNGLVEKNEQVTQTDILGIEPEVDNEQPLDRVVAEDLDEEKRLSKIVPNPRPLEKEQYNTVLTAYIKIKEKEEKHDADYQIPCYKELEKVDGLEKFYCDQGCYYLLEYDEFNTDALKCLAKMIVGDYSLPLKNSVEIFGERYKEATLEDGANVITRKGKGEKKDKKKKKGDKGSKSATKVKKSKEKVSKSTTSVKAGKGKKSKGKGSKSTTSLKGKKGKKGKKDKKDKGETESATKVIEREDKEVQVPMIEDEEEELPAPKPGEDNWEYINLSISDNIELSLAVHWDTLEANYVRNFKELFFDQRVLLNDIVPFLAKTRETMNEFIARPDEKQHYLREFQKTLNQIDLCLRNDEETKRELFCLINEFQEKLLGICDTKMRESEEERRNFVRQNWLFNQFCEMSNTVTVAFQLEMDRLVDTLQFLADYYTALITKSMKEGYEFHKETLLPKHKCDVGTSEAFNVLFIDMTSAHKQDTQFHKYVHETKSLALAFVESMKPLALKPVAEMKKLFEPQVKESKKDKKAKRCSKFEPDEEVKENSHRIFEEWQCAIDGEFARIHIHLNVIGNEAWNRLDNVITWIQVVFKRIFDDVSQRYKNESASVEKACRLLTQSVEQEIIIHPELTFEGDQLAQIEITLFPPVGGSSEDCAGCTFKPEQLECMVRILFDLAPDGFITKNTFLLLIQDILYDDEESDTPQLWRNLPIPILNALLLQLFDDEKYLYWKDFIVCNLSIPFPTNEELMDVRKQFRLFDSELTEHVTRQEFDSISFWFDTKNDTDGERLKNIIFRMYQIDKDSFNYTPMLLDFCKDEDQIRGFVKALELSLGKYICYDKSMGEAFVTEILQDRILFEEQVKEHEETMLLAKRAMSLLIDKIVDDVDGPEGFDLKEIEDKQSASSIAKSLKSELSQDKLISERKFSYNQIGFEARDDTEMCYFLPLELVLIIVKTEISWNSKLGSPHAMSFKDEIVQIYEDCRNENFNNVVLSHEFLNSEQLRELFGMTRKFQAHNPIRIVKTLLEEDEGREPDEFQLRPAASVFSASHLPEDY